MSRINLNINDCDFQALENTSGWSKEKDEEHKAQVTKLQEQFKESTENTQTLNIQPQQKIDEVESFKIKTQDGGKGVRYPGNLISLI